MVTRTVSVGLRLLLGSWQSEANKAAGGLDKVAVAGEKAAEKTEAYTKATGAAAVAAGKGRLAVDNMSDAELRHREATLKLHRASVDLTAAQKAAARTLADSSASDERKQRSLVRLGTAELGHARALRGVQAAAAETDDRLGRLGRTSMSVGTSFGHMRVGISKAATGLGQAIPYVGAAAVGIGLLADRVLDHAVALDQMDRKSRRVLGGALPQLEEWAERVGPRMGKTTREVLNLTAGFSDMLVPMGMNRVEAARLGQKFASLAPVLAEWSNGQFDVAATSEALAGSLTGEYDTLQRLGVPISDALVRSEALRLGLVHRTVDTDALSIAQRRAGLAQTRYNDAVRQHGKGSEEATRASLALQVAQRGVEKAAAGSAEEISSAAKAQAALSLITKGSADAQRSYAANTAGLAAQANIARADLATLRDELVVAVTPWLTTAFTWFNAHKEDIALGLVGVGRAGAGVATVLSGVASAGLYVGAALTYAAGAAAFARGNMAMGREMFATARGLQDAAGKAIEFGNSIQGRTNPALDALEAKLQDAKAAADGLPRSKVIWTSAPGAVRSAAEINSVRFAAGQLPRSKTVDVNIRSNAAAAVAAIQYQLNSIQDRTTYQTTVLRTVRAAQAFPSGGYAEGTDYAAPGWHWVGEAGPELLNLRGGEQVLSAAGSARAIADGLRPAEHAGLPARSLRPAGAAAGPAVSIAAGAVQVTIAGQHALSLRDVQRTVDGALDEFAGKVTSAERKGPRA